METFLKIYLIVDHYLFCIKLYIDYSERLFIYL